MFAAIREAPIAHHGKDLPAKKFESAGFDNLGGFDLEQFDPR